MQQLLIEQTGQKPDRSVIEPYDAVHIPFCTAVIPGTYAQLFQEASAHILRQKNSAGIDTAAKPDTSSAETPGERRKQKGHAVNGEHKKRGLPHKPPVAGGQGDQGRKSDLHAPPGGAAF